MGQKEFDILLVNMGKMTTLVEKLPVELRDMVYSSLVDVLLDRIDSTVAPLETVDVQAIQASEDNNGSERNIAEELEKVYRHYSLDSISDMDYATFVAYFFARLAPPDDMTDRIDESLYRKACMITGRKFPKRISGTMNNAKNQKGYLESHGGGVYSISAMGEHHVKHRLLTENEL